MHEDIFRVVDLTEREVSRLRAKRSRVEGCQLTCVIRSRTQRYVVLLISLRPRVVIISPIPEAKCKVVELHNTEFGLQAGAEATAQAPN